jgi:hypothetical protein
MFRYELLHSNDAEFIAYQRQLDGGAWQIISRWMIPGTDHRGFPVFQRERQAQE